MRERERPKRERMKREKRVSEIELEKYVCSV
jgi:hypothetical protein